MAIVQAIGKHLASLAVSALMASQLSACAILAGRPLSNPMLHGQVENNVYTSPDKSFRVRLPWLTRGATIQDEMPTNGTLLVTVTDDLCREFILSRRPGFLGPRSLSSWVDAHIIAELTRAHFTVRSKTIDTRNGPAVLLRYSAPTAAPCSRMKEVDGKKVNAKLDADVGWYVYHRDGRFYRLIYSIGIGPDAPHLWYVRREPVEEMLANFADGFEILQGVEQITR